jgi:hypothetical protein
MTAAAPSLLSSSASSFTVIENKPSPAFVLSGVPKNIQAIKERRAQQEGVGSCTIAAAGKVRPFLSKTANNSNNSSSSSNCTMSAEETTTTTTISNGGDYGDETSSCSLVVKSATAAIPRQQQGEHSKLIKNRIANQPNTLKIPAYIKDSRKLFVGGLPSDGTLCLTFVPSSPHSMLASF